MKGLATRNTHMQYENFVTSGLKDVAKVKVFAHAIAADANGSALTLAPRTYLSRLAKNVSANQEARTAILDFDQLEKT